MRPMIPGPGRAPGGPFRHLLVVVPFLLTLAGCEGDTLYGDDPLSPAPVLAAHQASVQMTLPERLEASDSFRVRLQATSGKGHRLSRVGVTALFSRPGGRDTLVQVQATDLAPAQEGSITRDFHFRVPGVDPLSLPQGVEVAVYAFAVNEGGACIASGSSTLQGLPCTDTRDGGKIAASGTLTTGRSQVVEGQSFPLPAAGRIADLFPVLGGTPRLILSNLSAHALQVLDLDKGTWSSVAVGSEPWGLGLNLRGDTLIVGNSGGTNLSFVSTASLREDVGRRLSTPNAVLFQVTVAQDTLGNTRYQSTFYDFSDRPQFLAQDASGAILYSTRPTEAANPGSIRHAEFRTGWERAEVRILFTGAATGTDASAGQSINAWSLAHLDSLRIYATPGGSDRIALYDHVPGFPSRRIQSPLVSLDSALAAIRAMGSDVEARPGSWNIDEVALTDTTFIAASGDRNRIAIGEGARGPAGRIFLWEASTRRLSDEISVADLVSNASERVTGLSLNQDGSLGLARGEQAAYFFNPDLRLQGLYAQNLKGGGGATLRSEATERAFVASANRSIFVVEPTHYRLVREIPIRETVVGGLRVSGPLASDNQGLSCPADSRCVVNKLYGVSQSGGIVIVNVRARDLQ